MAFDFNLFNVMIVIDRGPSPSGERGLLYLYWGQKCVEPGLSLPEVLRTEPVAVCGLSQWRSVDWASGGPKGRGRAAIRQLTPRSQITGADTYFASQAKASPMGPPGLGLGLVPSWRDPDASRGAGFGVAQDGSGPHGTNLGPQDESGPRRMNQGHTGRTKAR